jgi:hypothetical protein
MKISSKVTNVGVAKLAPAYIIDVHGSLKIDSVKITSWNPTTNYLQGVSRYEVVWRTGISQGAVIHHKEICRAAVISVCINYPT